MWRDFWQQHRAVLCSILGMVCFLVAGLMVRALPGVREKLIRENSTGEKPVASESVPPRNVEQVAPRANEPLSAPSYSPLPAARVPGRAETGLFDVEGQEEDERHGAEMILYITGSVRKPGVYRLPAGSRLFQLVALAGGLRSFADSVAINMAAPLEDGAHVHIPSRGDNRKRDAGNTLEPTIVVPIVAPPERRTNVDSRTPARGPIDINRATAEELTALKGIGPVLARNIVEYRSRNGRFRSVDELLRVKGIGDKKLEGFRKSVTVGP
ncbi:MAG: helix-hairpin-helix domain-containing protein [Synergistaceae bacterium]|nr:helix-hairpin-helix domain-containing protein [Synergistaceae bacterium]